jgi:hypothetical protein
MVEKRSTALFFSRKLKPKGPMITPEMISPIIPGILNFRNKIGAKSIINRINEKTRTGFDNGRVNSCII